MSGRDEQGRLLPGSVPGWGMSWWMVDEAGVPPEQFAALSSERRLGLIRWFWRAVADGWQPTAPREEWVGSHDPFNSPAIGEPDPGDPGRVLAALDAIPGALDHARQGLREAARGEGVPLERLADPDAERATPKRRGAATPDPWLAAIRRAIENGPADPDNPDREIREVLALALTPVGVDRWFELPNPVLDGRRPADAFADDPRSVLRAACELAFGAG